MRDLAEGAGAQRKIRVGENRRVGHDVRVAKRNVFGGDFGAVPERVDLNKRTTREKGFRDHICGDVAAGGKP
jgi:hypothetical protein